MRKYLSLLALVIGGVLVTELTSDVLYVWQTRGAGVGVWEAPVAADLQQIFPLPKPAKPPMQIGVVKAKS